MIVALTGATGFVGGATLAEALAQGHTVRALTRREQPPREGVTWVRGDLADAAALRALCAGAEAMIHIAGVVNAPDAAGFEAGNVAGTAAVIAAMQAERVPRLVAVSSLAARAPGLSDYGASKARAEPLVRASGLDWTIVRPPAVYGPRDTEMLELFRAAARFGVVPMPAGGCASLIHVADLARLLVALVPTRVASGRTFAPDDGRPGGWAHPALARAIGEAVGRPVRVIEVPGMVLRLAARLDRAVRGGRAKLTPDRARYMAYPDWVVDAAQRPDPALWAARVPTDQGLAETAQWYRGEGLI